MNLDFLCTQKMDPLFIVGTGRCGSTLLSKMVKHHPTCLSISEFFPVIADLGFQIAPIFQDNLISGDKLWHLITATYPRERILLRHNLVMDEMLYPMTETSRFNRHTGVPAIMRTMLPHLTEHPESLFDDLQTWCLQRPDAPPTQHFQALFQYLAERFGKTAWVERSGGTLRVVQQLGEHFPNTKFLHVVRDGRNCALSMSKHVAFRMIAICFQLINHLGSDPFTSDDRTMGTNLPAELTHLLPENFTAESFWNYPLPPSLFGHYWSGEIKIGINALQQLPEERVMTLYYEDFLRDPEPQIRQLAYFLDSTIVLTDSTEHWIQQSVKLVGRARSKWEDLPVQEKEALHQACLPGFEVLQAYA